MSSTATVSNQSLVTPNKKSPGPLIEIPSSTTKGMEPIGTANGCIISSNSTTCSTSNNSPSALKSLETTATAPSSTSTLTTPSPSGRSISSQAVDSSPSTIALSPDKESKCHIPQLVDDISESFAVLCEQVEKIKGLSKEDNGSSESILKNALEVITGLRQTTFKFFETVQTSWVQVNELEQKQKPPAPPRFPISDMEINIEDMTEYFAILIEAHFFMIQCKYEKLKFAANMVIIRIVKMLKYFMSAYDVPKNEVKFQSICAMIYSKPKFCSLNRDRLSLVMLSLWDHIRAREGGSETSKEAAIIDHLYLGTKFFRQRFARCCGANQVLRQREAGWNANSQASNFTTSFGLNGLRNLQPCDVQQQQQVVTTNTMHQKILIYQQNTASSSGGSASQISNPPQFPSASGQLVAPIQQGRCRKMARIEVTRMPAPVSQAQIGTLGQQAHTNSAQRVSSSIYVPTPQLVPIAPSVAPTTSTLKVGKRKRVSVKSESSRRNVTKNVSKAKSNTVVTNGVPTYSINGNTETKGVNTSMAFQGEDLKKASGNPTWMSVNPTSQPSDNCSTAQATTSSYQNGGTSLQFNQPSSEIDRNFIQHPNISSPVEQSNSCQVEDEIEEFRRWLGLAE